MRFMVGTMGEEVVVEVGRRYGHVAIRGGGREAADAAAPANAKTEQASRIERRKPAEGS